MLAGAAAGAARRRAPRGHPGPDRVRHRRRRLLDKRRRDRRRAAVAARAVGNAALPQGYRLDRAAVADMVALGWSPPGVVPGSGELVRAGRHDGGGRPDRPAAVPHAARRVRRPAPGLPGLPGAGRRGRAVDRGAAGHRAQRVRPGRRRRGATWRTALAEAADAQAERDDVLDLAERVRTVVSTLLKSDAERLQIDSDGDINIRAGFGDGLRPGAGQPAPGGRPLPGAHRGRADRAALRQALRADQPDADRPALLRRRHGLGVDPGLRPQLPGHPPHAGRAGDDRSGRRAGRPAARRVRRQAVLR